MNDSKTVINVFLKEYLGVLKLERNLSVNTVTSYKNDINSMFRFIEDHNIDDPSKIDYHNAL